MRAGVSTTETDPAALLERVLASPADDRRRPREGGDHQGAVRGHAPRRHADPVPGRRRRPRHQGQHAAQHGRARHRGDGAARHVNGGGDPGRQPRRGVLQQRPGGPGGARLRRGRHARGPGRRRAGLRHLLRQPDPVPGAGPVDVQAALRPPGRQPAGDGPGHRPGLHHQPQPRLRRRAPGPGPRRDGAGDPPPRPARDAGRMSPTPPASRSAPPTGRPSSATSTSTTASWRGSGCWTTPPSASSTTPRPPPARTTR